MFKPVSPKVDFPQIEEEILKYWKENKIFEKSVEKDAPNGDWTFLDGPPFVTGMPHYGSLLSSLPKDLFGRYFTMKGYRVRRVWGWDGHGLPIENKVEGELDIKRKKDIEDVVGIKKFIERCLFYVNQVSGEWEWYVDHIGRWVDFKNAYKTWDLPYMESVMWVFHEMYKKGFIYKGLKVSLYCPHCATPISNFEVAMDAENYKEIPDAATTYKYELANGEWQMANGKTYILAWSTTPWNKIVTPALAVNPKLDYVKVKSSSAKASADKQGEEYYILAKSTLKILDGKYEIVDEFKGTKLNGVKFVPHYDYYRKDIKEGEKAFEVVADEFVTADEGTGVVTLAVYGEEDLKVMKEQNIHMVMHVDEEGMIKPEVPLFGGMYYLKANKAVEEDLEKRGLIYKAQELPHNVPLCWRCHTRLYYAPINAWYVNVQDLKDKMKKTNDKVNWFPKHFKHGRFEKSLENAPDWNISRNRYWGSPVPVWECECGERFVPGSIKELEERSGREVKNLHKPDIDEVTVKCEKCGKEVHRVPEVLDSWIEAGSASFAERHYPFGENQPSLESFYPPDFIAEYTGQIRAWFYVLHVIANVLQPRQDGENMLSRNVLVEGVILGTDGRKMSKNFKNYPDPKEMLQKYGGDALRLYLMGSPVMNGEDILISEDQYKMQVRGTMLILWNVYNFFVTYANIDGWSPSRHSGEEERRLQNPSVAAARDSGQARMTSQNVLDIWILSLLNGLVSDVTKSLDGYDTVSSIDSLKNFVTDFSTWYIRRSRDRVGPTAPSEEDRNAFYETTYEVLVTVSKLFAPIAPFISEAIHTNLTGEESVHLAEFPTVKQEARSMNQGLIEQMKILRLVVELGHSARKKANIKLRQPLYGITISFRGTDNTMLNDQLNKLVEEELNIKKILVNEEAQNMIRNHPFETSEEKDNIQVSIMTEITPELKAEGEARDIVRQIQDERKKLGTDLSEKVDVVLESWPESFEEYIKKNALVNNLSKGKFEIKRLP